MVYLVYSHIDRINTSQTLSGSPHATEPQNRNSFCDMRTVTVHRLLGNAAVPGAAVGRPWTFFPPFLTKRLRKATEKYISLFLMIVEFSNVFCSTCLWGVPGSPPEVVRVDRGCVHAISLSFFSFEDTPRDSTRPSVSSLSLGGDITGARFCTVRLHTHNKFHSV